MWVALLISVILAWWFAIFLFFCLFRAIARWLTQKYPHYLGFTKAARARKPLKLTKIAILIVLSLLPFAEEFTKAALRAHTYKTGGGFRVFEHRAKESFWIDGHSKSWVLFNKTNVSGIIVDRFFEHQPVNPNNVFRMSLRKGPESCNQQFGQFNKRLQKRDQEFLLTHDMCLNVEESSDTDIYILEVTDWIIAPESGYLFIKLFERRWLIRIRASGKVVSQYRQLGTLPGFLLSNTPAGMNLVTTPIDIDDEFPLHSGEVSSLEDRIFSKLIDLAN